jgi:hypothetical protein
MNNFRMKSTFFIMFVMIGSVTFLNTIFEGRKQKKLLKLYIKILLKKKKHIFNSFVLYLKDLKRIIISHKKKKK